MGFLSGVLSNIQGHLGQHKEQINNAITSLKQNKHGGKKGFNVAIGSVVKGVRGYNKAVEQSNKKVSEPMTLILSQVNEEFKSSVAEILPQETLSAAMNADVSHAVDQINEKLRHCHLSAEKFNGTFNFDKHNKTILNAVNDLNPNLVIRVKNSLSNVKHESERLKALSDKEKSDLQAMRERLSECLEALGKGVNCKVSDKVTELVDYLKGKVQEILKLLNSINNTLQQYVAELGQWIDNANVIVEAAEKKIEIILQETKGSNRNQIETAATLITAEAEVLFKQFDDLNKKYDGVFKVIKGEKGTGQGNEGGVLGKLRTIHTDVETQVNSGVKDIKNALQENIKRLKEGINAKLKGYVEDELGGQIRDALKVHTDEIAGHTASSKPIKRGYLDLIVQGVEAYAREVETGKLDKVLKQWATDILKDVKVNRYIIWYAEANSAQFNGGTGRLSDRVSLVNTAISETFPEVFKASVAGIAATTLKTATVANIAVQFEKFASQLESDLRTKADDFAGKVEAHLKRSQSVFTHTGKEQSLKSALNAILPVLAGICKHYAEEIISFLKQSTISTNLPEAVKAIQNLSSKIENDVKDTNTRNGKVGYIIYDGLSGKVKNQANPYIDTFAQEAFKHGTHKFTTELERDLQEPVINKLNRIQNDVNDLVDAANKSQTELFNKSQEVTSHIAALCIEIKNAASDEHPDGVTTKLKELRDLINNNNLVDIKGKKQKGLNKIHSDLSELRSSLMKGPIQKAQDFIQKEVTSIKLQIVTGIHKFVDSSVDETKRKLTTQAQKQYVTSVKGFLMAFAVAVEKELKSLPLEIEHDLKIGLKGFMSILQTHFITQEKALPAIKSIAAKSSTDGKSPLSQAAVKFYGGMKRVFENLKKKPEFTTDFEKTQASHDALRTLLTGLDTSQHFDSVFSDNLDKLKVTLVTLTSHRTCTSSDWILGALKEGFTALVEELQKSYISTYSLRTIDWKTATAEEQEKYAKIALTVTPILHNTLEELKDELEKSENSWKAYTIYNPKNTASSLHKLFFCEHGYDVRSDAAIPYGELNHKSDCNGARILGHLTRGVHILFAATEIADISALHSADSYAPTVQIATADGVIETLYAYLGQYFNVCHLIIHPKTRPPCSVYEQLVWLTGLQFNPVYGTLCSYFKELFAKPKQLNDVPYANIPEDQLTLVGTTTIQPGHLKSALHDVCSASYPVLATILGHGHKDGIYACEFSDNSLKLDYPTSMIQLLCTLFDLLKRLYHQLYFLLQQCQLTTQLSGWRDCHYGRYIGGSGWQCNTKQCPKQDCNEKHNQSGNQRGEQYPNCGVKSPLQSFLEDGLKGHLPHSVAARGSSLSCGTCGSTPGMPCRTPMGFADIGATASHTMIGRNIREVLEAYCGRPNSPLTRLCSYLNCLLPSAPKTLADMFSFYYHLTDRWGMYGQAHKSIAFRDTVEAANFGRDYGKLNVYHLFTPSHSALKKGHSDGSLGSLVCLSRDSVVCGPYLRPIGHAIYETFSSEHADKYLSWIVYLTATFYDLLKKLYDECNSKCGPRGSNCHKKACIKECPTTSKKDPPRYHDAECKSIVKCNSTLPTLAKYGFVLGDPERLNGNRQSQTKRTCRDFCNVFAEAFEEDSHLVKFFKAIDNFMFTIRQPFIWLNVALWSLSLFYLICVMVGRLDVLHIRSHLRSPSSHKITAQSLLAPAQVGRLAKISYLQP
ncbi:hypothetical protein BBBOND_0313830 [Babesia bigemina]|uniref:C3H1-type domain-containing protein n=1 Tax=Babesia bigemina TaxID=5866 RepID=A0A061D9V0_BABBI|nr:hypothetical protein BBBOND_0313830 [Babesia bigemina]CDR97481.1 hypothetical protein BBBOND_0313830 [Babesia bigemina]|eukprot:XP_012769667.1 hypothetical protein BBBOND_0313830 [Babesia bigemina]